VALESATTSREPIYPPFYFPYWVKWTIGIRCGVLADSSALCQLGLWEERITAPVVEMMIGP